MRSLEDAVTYAEDRLNRELDSRAKSGGEWGNGCHEVWIGNGKDDRTKNRHTYGLWGSTGAGEGLITTNVREVVTSGTFERQKEEKATA